MNAIDLKNIIAECVNDVTFDCNNKHCGVTAEVENYKPTFLLWYGDEERTETDINEVMTIRLFGGKSLADICERTEFNIA